MAAIFLGYQIIADPANAMKAWFITMYVHFAAFFGATAACIFILGFNEKASIVAALIPAMVFVFGNAWVVQVLVTLPKNKPAQQNQQTINPNADEQSSGGVGGLDGQIVEAQL